MTNNQNEGVKGSEENLKRKGRKKLGCVMMGCAIPIGLVLLLGVAYLIWRVRAKAAVREIEEQIVERGEPINAEELNKVYFESATGKDKTPLFVAFIPQLESESFLEQVRELPIVSADGVEMPIDPSEPFEMEAEVRAFLADNPEIMQAIEEAALADGDVRFPYDFRQGFVMLLPQVQALRTASRLLDLQARFAVREGDSDKAFRSVRGMLGLGEALEDEPILISQLVRIAIRTTAQETICDLLPEADFSDDQLRQLSADCAAPDWQKAAKDSLVGERAFGRTVFNDPAAISEELGSLRYVITAEDERFHLQLMTDIVNATDNDFPEMITELERLEDELGNLTQFQQMTHPISMLVTPALTSAVTAYAKAEARDEAMVAQLVIELYARKHGQPPTNWDDLIPEFIKDTPRDPFTRQPLQYQFDEEEIVVYSVGPDLVDDGGDDVADVVLRVKRKPPE